LGQVVLIQRRLEGGITNTKPIDGNWKSLPACGKYVKRFLASGRPNSGSVSLTYSL